MSPDLLFCLAVLLLGVIVWALAVAWSRRDMRKAIIKGVVEMRRQEENVRRITGN